MMMLELLDAGGWLAIGVGIVIVHDPPHAKASIRVQEIRCFWLRR
jgi:hypothetical protein